METPPKIYLHQQIDPEYLTADDVDEGVIWCRDRINDSDIEYVLAARVKALENQLERLTPGGSEFHGNPERCLDFIQDAMKGVSSQVVKRKQAEARVEELEALLADALYLFYHPDRVRKLVMIDRIEQVLEDVPEKGYIDRDIDGPDPGSDWGDYF